VASAAATAVTQTVRRRSDSFEFSFSILISRVALTQQSIGLVKQSDKLFHGCASFKAKTPIGSRVHPETVDSGDEPAKMSAYAEDRDSRAANQIPARRS
jgi:hypothetical protein